MALGLECQPCLGDVQKEASVPNYNLLSTNKPQAVVAGENLLHLTSDLRTDVAEAHHGKEIPSKEPSLTQTEKRTVSKNQVVCVSEELGTATDSVEASVDDKGCVQSETTVSGGESCEVDSVVQEREDAVSETLIEGCDNDEIFVEVMECEEGDTLLQLGKCNEGDILLQVQDCDQDQILIEVGQFEEADPSSQCAGAGELCSQGEERLTDGATEMAVSLAQSGHDGTTLRSREEERDKQNQQALQDVDQQYYYYCCQQENQAEFLGQSETQNYNCSDESSDPASQRTGRPGSSGGFEEQCVTVEDSLNLPQQSASSTDEHGALQGLEWGAKVQWEGFVGTRQEQSVDSEDLKLSAEGLEQKLKASLTENEQMRKQLAFVQGELSFSQRETEETRNAAASMLDSLKVLCEQQAEINRQQNHVQMALRSELEFLKAELKYKEERSKEMRSYIMKLEADKQAKDHALFQHVSMIENLRSTLSLREMSLQKDKALLKERDVQLQDLQAHTDGLAKQVRELKDTLTLKKASESGNVMIMEALQQQVSALMGEKLQLAERLEKLLQEKLDQDKKMEKFAHEANKVNELKSEGEMAAASPENGAISSEEDLPQRDNAAAVSSAQPEGDKEEPRRLQSAGARLATAGEATGEAASEGSTLDRVPGAEDTAAASDPAPRDEEGAPPHLSSLLRSLLHSEDGGSAAKRKLCARKMYSWQDLSTRSRPAFLSLGLAAEK